MSNDRRIYVGTYLKVWMPKVVENAVFGKCPKCNQRAGTPFCALCGVPIIFGTTERMADFYDYAEEVFGEDDDADDLFSVDMEDEFYLVFPNSFDMKCGENVTVERYYGSDLETPIPEEGFKHPAWQKLIDALMKDYIGFEIGYGIVNYVEH